MRKHLRKDIPFTLVAHSYGCVVALEMVALLEKEGINGIVFLVDGSPKMTAELVKKQLGEKLGHKFEKKLLEWVLSNFMPVQSILKIIVSFSSLLFH